MQHAEISFCDDSQLSYDKFATRFHDNQGLKFDDSYRLGHLPLVAPDHPDIISTKPGTSYYNGVHEIVYSIAIPIAENELLSSRAFKRLVDEIKNTAFAAKLSWDTFEQRKSKLHATIYGLVSKGQAPNLKPEIYQALRSIGPVSVNIRGLFSGNINIGRLYLKLYPELRDGRNMCHVLQKALGTPLTDLYVIGLFNFVEELNVSEARELNSFLRRWQDTDIIQLQLDKLWLLESKDHLVLDGAIVSSIPLV